jgi:hemolysin activation/secretion protein
VFGGGLNSYGYTITEGSADFSGTIADPTVVGRFAKHNFEFRRLQKITDNATLLLSLSGQMGSKNLTSAERFSLGGASGVRAYPAGEALGDTGWVFQGELRYIIPNLKIASGDVTVSGFWDQGWVRLQENFVIPAAGVTAADANNRRLSGYGLGGSIGKDSDFVLRASVAWRNENQVAQSDTAPRIPRVWVQGIKWF